MLCLEYVKFVSWLSKNIRFVRQFLILSLSPLLCVKMVQYGDDMSFTGKRSNVVIALLFHLS